MQVSGIRFISNEEVVRSVHRSPRPRSTNATGPADVCRQLQRTSSRKPIPEGYSAEKTTTSRGCHDLD